MMADSQNMTQSPGAVEPVPQAPQGGFLASIVDIFADPFKVFARIDAGLTWWKPFVFVSVVMMITSYLLLPLQRKVMELNMRNLSEEQLQKAVEGYGKWAPLGLITVPIALIIIYLIVSGVMHLVVNIMSSRSSFKKTLSLISFCGIITIVEQIIVAVVLRMRGPESIESAADMKFSLSLAPLVGEGKGLLAAVLQSLSIFQIWYYVVLVLGIAAIFKISRKAAIIPVLPIWIISIIVIWIGGKFGGGMG
jgi:hypothetical protein